MTAKSMMMLP